jgi:hypothetical protein
MEEERVNLYVTKCQLDLILESALRCSYSWKRTHDAIMKGDDDVSDVEECTTECEAECEAEYMRDAYDELKELLQVRQQEIGVNRIETVATDYVARANQTLEVIKLTKGTSEKLVYVYNFRGLDYYFFPNLCEMVQFFDEGKEPEHIFSSDRELDMFLRFF